MVEDFERVFAQFCGTQDCIGVGSGTDALRFALIASGVRAGDAVVTVPSTFIATTEAISQAGAFPEFVDIDERTYTMDPSKLQNFLERKCYVDSSGGRLFSRRTQRHLTAIVPVHLYGQMADMDRILELAKLYNLIVIEDACQAHGAEYFSKQENCWKPAGSMSHAASFSFYPGKNLGACGEAGAVTTADVEIARIVRMLRDHGQAQKYFHEMEGYNGRLDSVQAGILTVKLRHLADWNRKRQEAARRYNVLFDGIEGVIAPFQPEWSRAVYHLYVVRVQNRGALREFLEASQIGTGIHYPVPLHLQEAYRSLGYRRGDFPVSEQVAAEIVSMPMYSHIQADQQSRVANKVSDFVSSRCGQECSSSAPLEFIQGHAKTLGFNSPNHRFFE
jgi:dTDP-4-amino-4,6-dideoxygalactose transaminase